MLFAVDKFGSLANTWDRLSVMSNEINEVKLTVCSETDMFKRSQI